MDSDNALLKKWSSAEENIIFLTVHIKCIVQHWVALEIQYLKQCFLKAEARVGGRHGWGSISMRFLIHVSPIVFHKQLSWNILVKYLNLTRRKSVVGVKRWPVAHIWPMSGLFLNRRLNTNEVFIPSCEEKIKLYFLKFVYQAKCLKSYIWGLKLELWN